MNIYKLTPSSYPFNSYYDKYDEVVVVAASEEEAKKIHPGFGYSEDWSGYNAYAFQDWELSPDLVIAEYIGMARDSLSEPKIISKSFKGS